MNPYDRALLGAFLRPANMVALLGANISLAVVFYLLNTPPPTTLLMSVMTVAGAAWASAPP